MESTTHRYSFATTGLSKDYSKEFSTREAANALMYRLIGKLNLHIEEVWDDHHDKTYCCDNGAKFYIHRI